MKYIVCNKPGEFQMLDKSAPRMAAGEALLKVKRVGICGTDLHAYTGNQAYFTYPRILGHELACEVVEIEDNPQGLQPGDTAVVMPYLYCQQCGACRNGQPNCCTNIEVYGVHRDGGMQDQMIVPSRLLLRADGLSLDEVAVVEPLAIGAHALRRSHLKKGDQVVVVGCGPIGLGIIKLSQIIGAEVIAIDIDAGRLARAQENFGASHVVLASNRAAEEVASITNGDLADVVFHASGHKEALETGTDYMAHGGRYVLVGLSKGELVFTHPKIHAKETTIMCSRNATLEDFRYVINVLQYKKFPIEDYVTHKVDMGDMIDEFESWLDPANGIIKAIVNF